MQNAKPSTRFLFLLTAYRLLPTGNRQLLSHGRVHWWTSAGKTPKKSHFVSLFRPPGVTSRWQSSIHKPFHARQIGPDMEASQRAKHDVGRGLPKVSHRCSLIVQYLQPKNAVPDSPYARG
jgi:hypothetical protein